MHKVTGYLTGYLTSYLTGYSTGYLQIEKYRERMKKMEQAESSQLNLARKIEKKGILETPAAARPAYHLSSPVGWMNDPNGFSVYKGEYHLFFQYHPFSKTWGPMHWGHSRSRDFIRWEYLPAAMAPDES